MTLRALLRGCRRAQSRYGRGRPLQGGWQMNPCKKIAAGLVAGISLAAQLLMLSTEAFAERKYSDWSPAVNLGCTVNSGAQDLGPAY